MAGTSGLIVADSDLVIDWLRDHGPGAEAIERWLVEQRLRLTSITAFELRQGHDFLVREDDVMRLLQGRTLTLDAAAALTAGAVFAALTRSGRGIGVKDCLQAGTCLSYGLPLATRNRRHFERITELRLAEFDK